MMIEKFHYQKLKRFIDRRVSQPEDAEELLQEIFMKIHLKLPQLKDEEKFLFWIHRIARNQLTDFYRKKNPSYSPATESETEEDSELQSTVAGWLTELTGTLSEPDQEILSLVEAEGLTQAEAADRLGLTLPAAKSRHQRAKKRLQDALLSCCHVYFDKRGNVLDVKRGDQCPLCCERETN